MSYLDGNGATNYSSGPLLTNSYVKLGFEARNGDVYLVDGSKNILVLSGEHFTAQYTNQDWPDGFAEDSRSVLVGVGGKLNRIENGALHPFEYQGTPPEYYWIRNLYVAKDGAIWVASNNGLFRVKDGAYKQWPTLAGFAGSRVLWVCEDEDGTIWAGSSAGIARIKNDEVKNISHENGLPDDMIYAMVADNHGYLWADSGRGIFRASRASLNDFADGKTGRVQAELFEGLESVKFKDRTDQDNSGCKTQDGRIWFPNPLGVVMIDPEHFFTNSIAPPVYLQRVTIDDVTWQDRESASLRQRADRVEFFFSALSYIAPKKMQIRYQLEGFDTAWIDAGPQRSARYNNLPPGKYVFRIQACNADGVWNSAGSNFSLEVPPAFYETVWFDGLGGLAGVLGLIGIHRANVRHIKIRQQKLQAQNELLEQKVSLRTAQLAQSNTSLQSEIQQHKITELELKRRTQSLEAEIEERRRMQLEVERVHQELLEASRMAGMAEVATGVLHNVGNVLNSVNVSATLLAEHIQKSKIGSVGRVASLLQENNATLGEFLANDPKGRRLPVFLAELAAHLAAEQASALAELTALQKNIGHIKDIVFMQQTYARVAGVTQTVMVSELVEDSLRMNESALLRHEVRVVREYEAALPEIVVDKHKVMQILINLIRNAKYACDEANVNDKHLIVRIKSDDGRIKIIIADNGVGIPPENLNRIFNHGFTTRKHGHGFGLHSGALAAKEMGGALTAHSDGPGKGARFVLELPLQPTQPT